MNLRVAVSLLILFLGTCAVPGQGTSFTYQGHLLDGGNPAQGLYDIGFRLFDQPTHGVQQGATLARTNLGVTNGLFTVELDFGPSAFPGSDRWLELAVQRSGDTNAAVVLAPRQALTATPYASRAATATTFSGTVADSQLSTNVALRDADQAFTGTVQFSSATGNFSGNGSGLTNLNASAGGKGGFLTGRIGQLPSAAGNFFGAAAGPSDAGAIESAVLSLSPNEAGTASNLSIRLTNPPGSGNSLTFKLRVNGADTAVACTLSGSTTTTNSGAASAAIPAGATLSIGIVSTGVPASLAAMLGWSFK